MKQPRAVSSAKPGPRRAARGGLARAVGREVRARGLASRIGGTFRGLIPSFLTDPQKRRGGRGGEEKGSEGGESSGGVDRAKELEQLISQVTQASVVSPEGKTEWREEGGRKYLQVKDDEMKGTNNFEKIKKKKSPWLVLDQLAAMAEASGKDFAALDSSDKEMQADIDIRLKWFGLFHRRKQQYGTFMMRLKIPNGILTSAQMRVLASIVEDYGEAGCGDITTRQNIQLRGIQLQDVPEIFAKLEEVGMTTFQSGMDNVRNAVGSPLCGIDPLEIVDTLPWCDAVTEYVTNCKRGNPRISNLPRKFNICVVGSHDLYEHPHINDLAFMPATCPETGAFGFNVLVGGYFSAAQCEEAIPLDAFVPESGVLHMCDAVLSAFSDFGARKNRQKCRMMYMVHEMGLEGFREEVRGRMPGGELARQGKDLVDPSRRRRDYHGVHRQKQEGLRYVGVNVPTGRIQAKDMHEMARLADEYGSGEVRLTVEQNYILPNVREEAVQELLAEPLISTGEGFAAAFKAYPGHLMRDLVACTGNQFCGLAQIETKAQGKALAEALEATMNFTSNVRMHWTGCPNTCGQVQVADIGFLGCQMRDEELGKCDGVKIFLGGNIGHEAELGTEVAEVPCQKLLPFTQNLLEEKFGATMKASQDFDAAAIERWENFPFNSGGTPEVFPPNGNGEYVKLKN